MGATYTALRLRNVSLSVFLFFVVGCASQPVSQAVPSPSPKPVATIKPRPTPKPTLPPRPIVAPFTVLRSGQQAVLGETLNGRTVICASGALWIEYDNSNPNACSTQAAGTRVTVLQVGPDSKHMQSSNKSDPLIQVQATDGSWTGWTDLTMIAPAVPPGTQVRLSRSDGQVTELGLAQTPAGNESSIGGNADAIALRQGTGDPAGSYRLR
jgi:hypothetical protein